MGESPILGQHFDETAVGWEIVPADEAAAQADIAHNRAVIAEILAIGSPGQALTGEQVAADVAAVRDERDAELLGKSAPGAAGVDRSVDWTQ